jgi:uncharacterized membrane protein YkoI
MRTRTKLAAAGLVVAALGAVGANAAMANSSEGPDTPISGEALDKANAAALAHTGAGRVTDTEVGDEESLYEVEVTLDDGTEIDVQLDADFAVVGSEAEDPNEVETGTD